MKKMAKNKGNHASIENDGLDLTPKVAFAKKKQIKVMKEKIETGGYSRYEEMKSHEMTKP